MGLSLAAAPAWGGEGSPGSLRVLKVRHATFLLDLDGARVLLDPWFSAPPGPVLFTSAPEAALSVLEVGRPHLLLVTSGSWDRFDPRSLHELPSRSAFCLVPDEPTAKALRNLGFRRVRQVRAGDQLRVRGVDVDVGPARDDWRGPAVSYRLERAGRSVWHTGSLVPLDVDDRPGRWAREHPSEVVLGGFDEGPGAALADALGRDDAYLLARLARARYLMPQGDEVRPASPWAALLTLWTGALGSDEGTPRVPGVVGGPRVVLAERGLWYRVARPDPAAAAAAR